MGVTGGGEHLEHAIINRQERDIESATAEIAHDDLRLATLLVKVIRGFTQRSILRILR